MSSLQGIFNTAVQAMQSQSQFLSNISTNIANVNTTAYKRQDTHFETLLNHVSPSSPTVAQSKSFFTVNTFDFRQVDNQGQVTTTGRAFDLALNGRGFMVTNSATDGTGRWQYTRDGALFGKAISLGTDTDNNGVEDSGTLLTTANGNYVYGWAAKDDGTFDQTDSLSSLTPVMYSNNSIVPSKQTEGIQLQANLSLAQTGEKRQSVGLPFVDQQGRTRTLTVGFTPNTDGTKGYTLDMSSIDPDNNPITVEFDPPNVSFDTLGNIQEPPGGQITALVNDLDGPQILTLDMSKVTQLGEQGEMTVQNITQDGYLEGRLNNTYFNEAGVLIGSYTNGEVKNLYKLPVATFQADNNLDAKPGNVFEQTADAGSLRLAGLEKNAGDTAFVVGALEQSNVDLADQFSKMIIAQRAYSSSAKVVQTADEMTQAARDLMR